MSKDKEGFIEKIEEKIEEHREERKAEHEEAKHEANKKQREIDKENKETLGYEDEAAFAAEGVFNEET